MAEIIGAIPEKEKVNTTITLKPQITTVATKPDKGCWLDFLYKQEYTDKNKKFDTPARCRGFTEGTKEGTLHS